MSRSVVVVGGGVVGTCSAYYLAKAGWEVTVLERDREEVEGCSFGNAGLVVPSHFVPLAGPGMVATGLKMMFRPSSPFGFSLGLDAKKWAWALKFLGFANQKHADRAGPLIRDLNLLSRGCYEELAADIGDGFGFSKTGLVMMCQREDTLAHEKEVLEAALAMGLKGEVWDRDRLQEEESAIETGGAGAIFFADDGMLSPGRFMKGLREEVVKMGGKIEYAVEVDGLDVRNGRVGAVRGGGEEWSGDEVLVATGSWSAKFLEGLGMELPVIPGKGYSFTLGEPVAKPVRPALLVESRVAVTPMPEGLRFAGTMELGDWRKKVNRARVDGIKRGIPVFYPQFTKQMFDKEPVWSGLRPCTPDGLPVVGRLSGWENVFVATGHAMMGLSLGPGTGKLVAEALSNQPMSLPIHALSVGRF